MKSLGLTLAALAFAASPATAAEYIFDSNGDQANITFNGFSGNSASVITGLSSKLSLKLLSGFGTNKYVFAYTLTNTSTAGGSDSRVSGFAFNSNPDVRAVLTSGDFDKILTSGTYPNGIGKVEVCLTGSNACAGGGGDGAELGEPATGVFTLTYAQSPSSVKLSDFYVRYQSLSGLRVSSASGQEVTSAVPEPGTWMLMILGLGAVGFAMRRKPKVAFRFQPA